MKKKNAKKVELNRITLARLNEDETLRVRGGEDTFVPSTPLPISDVGTCTCPTQDSDCPTVACTVNEFSVCVTDCGTICQPIY